MDVKFGKGPPGWGSRIGLESGYEPLLGGRAAAVAGKGPRMQDLNDLIQLFNSGRHEEVVARGEALRPQHPGDPVLHELLGAAYAQLRRLDSAAACYARAVELQPGSADAHNNLGITLEELGRHDEAIVCFTRALEIEPGFAEAHNNLGFALRALNRRAEAIQNFEHALNAKPDYVDAHINLGRTLAELGRFDEAIQCYTSALRIEPQSPAAHNNLGNVLRQTGRRDEAVQSYTRAVQINPRFADAHNNLGNALVELWRHQEAIASFMRALEINPNFAGAYNGLGVALRELRRSDEAIKCYARALQIDPTLADAHNNMGVALRQLGRADEALACFSRAAKFKPDFADAHNNLGITLADLRRHDEAIAAFTRALEIAPDHALALSQRIHQQALVCDWSAIDANEEALRSLGVTGGAVAPFALLAAEDNPARHRLRAERFAQEHFPPERAGPAAPAARPGRLRIGYFSGDFQAHAVMYLIARLFETHDRSRFSVHAFSYGPDKADPMRARIRGAVDAFHDVRALRDDEILDLARREGVDIAVDLSGYTMRTRSGMFAQRLAPIQINYLGYPGTMGAPFMDYIIADRVIIPETHRRFYSEKVIYLPHTYQANDNTRPISEIPVTRASMGLPDDGFVFCCFNNSYKITPREFDVWMTLLNQVRPSVLWLLRANTPAVEALRREAAARGIDPSRLIFAGALPLPEHLARHRLADLFLDTFNYNAHTTASDALWAGLPIVTMLGEGFAARVAGSLLSAVGLDELVTHSVSEYANLALTLATDPKRLRAIRQKLDANRRAAPLFDSELFTKHIESAYEATYQRYVKGEKPDDVVVND